MEFDIHYVETITSTNDAVKAFFETATPEGYVLVANQQTQGRGRTGPWFDEPDTMLLVTILLRPQARIPDVSVLTDLGGMAVYRTIKHYCEDPNTVRIKPPNDVLVGNKKIAGILTETQSRGELIEAVALGIGININVSSESFIKAGLGEIATSLLIQTDRIHEREEVLARLLKNICFYYEKGEKYGH